jgi:hypothetical protein
MHIATREKCNILSILSDGEMLEKTKCPNYFVSMSTAWSLVISTVNNQFSYEKTYHRKIKLKIFGDDFENTSLDPQTERDIERDQKSKFSLFGVDPILLNLTPGKLGLCN